MPTGFIIPESTTISEKGTRFGLTRLAVVVVISSALSSLVVAVWAGLGRIGAVTDAPLKTLHGPIMIFGFLGTVIAVERAVGLRRKWGWWVPVLSALGGISLLADRLIIGAIFLVLAGVGLTLMYVVSGTITGYETHTLIMGLGAVAWVLAATGIAFGASISAVVPAMAGFLVLTISGERVELSRLGPYGGGRWGLWLFTGAILMTFAAALSAVSGAGTRVAGVAMIVLATTGWFSDIARRTIRMTGLPRFMAAALLAGYGWLLVAGTIWVLVPLTPGSPGYDIAIHTAFVGFVLSMIFAHAAVIVPAITGINLPYRSMWWIPLVLLHVSLLARVIGRLMTTNLYIWGGIGNAVAIALFVLMAAGSAIVAQVSDEP